MADFHNLPLGRKTPHPPSKSKRMAFAAAFGTDLPAPSPARDWTEGATTRPDFGNTTYGDCTCAAIANNVVGVTKVAYRKDVQVSTDDVLALYANFGFDPKAKLDASGQNPTDGGAVFEDVLTYVLRRGFKGHHLIGSVAVAPSNADNIKRAIDWFGVACIGGELPDTWLSSTRWSLDGYSAQSAAWAPRNGHEFCAQKYDAGGAYVWTWGELVYLTWDAIAMYCDEVDAPIWASWIRAGNAPSGLSLDTLEHRMAQIKAA